MASTSLPRWPALEGLPDLPFDLQYQHGIWGKASGAGVEFRWLAATPGFPTETNIERELLIGKSEVPSRGWAWLSCGGTACAMSFYPSRTRDDADRTGFLEKQVFVWQTDQKIPSIIPLLFLLPTVTGTNDEFWRGEAEHAPWGDRGFHIELEPTAEISVTPRTLDERIAQGIDSLRQAFGRKELSDLYARLLAGGTAFGRLGAPPPLPPEALAAMVLPLPRDRVDRLSLLSWSPSGKVDPDIVDKRFDLVLGGPQPKRQARTPKGVQARASTMAQSLLDGDPSPLTAASDTDREAAGSEPKIVIWGFGGTGKTVLSAQLYNEAAQLKARWTVFPNKESDGFINEMLETIESQNRFPPPTPKGSSTKLVFDLEHRETGRRVKLIAEDRSGEEYRQGSVTANQDLMEADGVLLLLDTSTTLPETISTDLQKTLARIYTERGGQDGRPIAVCLTKADTHVANSDHLQQVHEDPEGFVKGHLKPRIVQLLEHYCTHLHYFPVSSVGIRQFYGVVQPTVFLDEEFKARVIPHGDPFGLIEPFQWMVEQLDGIAGI